MIVAVTFITFFFFLNNVTILASRKSWRACGDVSEGYLFFLSAFLLGCYHELIKCYESIIMNDYKIYMKWIGLWLYPHHKLRALHRSETNIKNDLNWKFDQNSLSEVVILLRFIFRGQRKTPTLVHVSDLGTKLMTMTHSSCSHFWSRYSVKTFRNQSPC